MLKPRGASDAAFRPADPRLAVTSELLGELLRRFKWREACEEEATRNPAIRALASALDAAAEELDEDEPRAAAAARLLAAHLALACRSDLAERALQLLEPSRRATGYAEAVAEGFGGVEGEVLLRLPVRLEAELLPGDAGGVEAARSVECSTAELAAAVEAALAAGGGRIRVGSCTVSVGFEDPAAVASVIRRDDGWLEVRSGGSSKAFPDLYEAVAALLSELVGGGCCGSE